MAKLLGLGACITQAECGYAEIEITLQIQENPCDTALLNEAQEHTEALIDALHTPGTKKPRTYRKCAHKDYLTLARSCKPNAKKIRKANGKRLG